MPCYVKFLPDKLKVMILKSKVSLFRILNMICIFNMHKPLGKGKVEFNWFISNSGTIKIGLLDFLLLTA